MKLHLPKGLLTAVLALFAVSQAYAYRADVTMGGDFYADSFEFEFIIGENHSITTSYGENSTKTYDIIAEYYGSSQSGAYQLNAFTLNQTDAGLVLYQERGGSPATATITSESALGQRNDKSIFKDENGTDYILGKGLYTVKFLGGDNDQAGAELYLEGQKVASFSGGKHNMNGKDVNMKFLYNSAYATISDHTWVATDATTAKWDYTTDAWSYTITGDANTTTGALSTGYSVIFGDAAGVYKTVAVDGKVFVDSVTINDNYTFVGTNSAEIDASSFTIADNKKMTLQGDFILRGNADLSKVEATNNLTLKEGSYFLTGGNTMQVDGTLTIGTAANVRMGYQSNEGNVIPDHEINLSSVDKIVMEGGTLESRCFMGNLGNIEVKENSVINSVDMNDIDTKNISIGTLTIDANKQLKLQTGWKGKYIVSALEGAGNLYFHATSGDSQGHHLEIGSVGNYTGRIELGLNSNNPANLKVTIAENEAFQASQIVSCTNSTVTLDGAGTYYTSDAMLAKCQWEETTGEGESAVTETHIADKGQLAETWTGIVALGAQASSEVTLTGADIALSALGNENSTLQLTLIKVTGNLASGSISTNIEFNHKNDTPALKLAGTTGTTLNFTKSVSGNGNFCVETTGATDNITFSGDVSEWSGKLISTGTTNFTYTGLATEINNKIGAGNADAVLGVELKNVSGMVVSGDINNEDWNVGTINLVVSNTDAATGDVELSGTVGTYGTVNMTVNEGASAVVSGSTKVSTLTTTGTVKVTGSGSLTYGGNTTVTAPVTKARNTVTSGAEITSTAITGGVVTFTGDADVTEDRTISNSSIVNNATGTANITAGSENVSINAASGNIAITADSTSVGDLAVASGKSVSTTGALTVTQSLTLSSTNALDVTGALTLDGASINLTGLDLQQDVTSYTLGTAASISATDVTVLLNDDKLAAAGFTGYKATVGASDADSTALVLTLTSATLDTLTVTSVADDAYDAANKTLTLGTALSGTYSFAEDVNITMDENLWEKALAAVGGYEQVTLKFTDAEGNDISLAGVTNMTLMGMPAVGGQVTISGNSAGQWLIPEPTTSTLSLLALAALAVRRRRK